MQAFSMQHNEESIDPNIYQPPPPMYGQYNYPYVPPQQAPPHQNQMFATTQFPAPMQHSATNWHPSKPSFKV